MPIHSQPSKVTIALSIGCPCGIGPQVSVVAAARTAGEGIRTILVGDEAVIRQAARQRALDDGAFQRFGPDATAPVMILSPSEALSPRDAVAGRPSAASGRAQLSYINMATDLVLSGQAEALVTGPVSKKAIASSGAPDARGFAGHTEHVASRTAATHPIMVFVAHEISTALVTTHLALKDVAARLTPEGVAQATARLAEMLWLLGKRPARIVVAALNPHAGENGMFGDEETRLIAPGIALARQELQALGVHALVSGPTGGETAFRQAFDGRFDGVVAMYHDQATIPMKVRCFGEAVNVTAGLPIVRTSVDHGTAYDIAGTNQADAASMVEAIRLAARLAKARRERAS